MFVMDYFLHTEVTDAIMNKKKSSSHFLGLSWWGGLKTNYCKEQEKLRKIDSIYINLFNVMAGVYFFYNFIVLCSSQGIKEIAVKKHWQKILKSYC